MDCSDRTRALVRHIDGELSPEESHPLLDHVAGCVGCRETLRLLAEERDCLLLAHRGDVELRAPRRSGLRTAGLAAALLVLLGAGLSRLHAFYSTTSAHLASEREAKLAEDVLGKRLTVSAEGVPLREFVSMLAEESGVPIRLAAAADPGSEPSVHLSIRTPVRLGSLVHLLEEFYGLRATVREGAVLLG